MGDRFKGFNLLRMQNRINKIMKEVQGLEEAEDGGFNSGKLWKLKKKLSPKSNEPPTAMEDSEGKLLTNDQDILEKANISDDMFAGKEKRFVNLIIDTIMYYLIATLIMLIINILGEDIKENTFYNYVVNQCIDGVTSID